MIDISPLATVKTRGWTRTACTEKALSLLLNCADTQNFRAEITWHRDIPDSNGVQTIKWLQKHDKHKFA